ncbi:hypothetical protein G9P44_003021 [Scheffersomyces stipitis]|nr:hypothetical protein G9P44_003021 [Scheffersomyces stipitis]
MSPFLVESAANTDQDRSQRSTTFNVETPPTPRFHHQPYTRSSSFTAAIAAAAAIAATPTLSNKIQKLPAMSSSQRRSSHDGLPTNSNKTTSKTSTTSSSSTTNSTNHITDSITNTGAIPITSIPEPSNAFPNSDPLVGMVNYSPKHSRKRSSLTMNRNMKNLSLNLGVSHSNSSSVDSNSSYTYNANSPSKSLPFNPPPSFGNSSQRSLPLSKSSSNDSTSNQTSSIKSSTSNIINSYFTTRTNSNTNIDNTSSTTNNNSIYNSNSSPTNFTTESSSTTTTILHVRQGSNNSSSHNQYDSPLVTPAVTRTPNLPPMIPRRANSSSAPHSSDIDVSREMGFKFPASTNVVNYADFKPPAHQFEEQPPKLRSPLILNGGNTPPLAAATRNIASDLATVSIKDLVNDDLDEFFPQPPHGGVQAAKVLGQSPGQIRSWSNTSSRKNYSNSSSNSLDSSDIRKLIIPEELQESNSLNAYKDGPRNVLNGQIYLYSDPVHSDSKVDINNFDLIVNVAKECQDMSLSYRNQVAGQREYIHVPWSHTSAISKDLLAITTKMEHFYSSGRRILVHCQCGVSRSACVVVAFFMSKFGLNVNEAYELLKSGTENINETVNRIIGEKGNRIDACDRICPNMSLIFELMEFGEILGQN